MTSVDAYHPESGTAPGINVSGLKNPLTEFFGPPAKVEFGAQDRLSHETWNLSEYADLPGQTLGKSPFMAVTIESLVTQFDEWPTRVLLPWIHTDSINVSWSIWRFDQTLADYEPEQAPPRYISSHTEHHTSRLVRRGLAFILEHGFWSTPGGRMAYVENLRTLQSACHETVQQATINALLAEGKAWERAWNERYGKPARSMRDVFELMNWTSFIVNKRDHGWEVLDAYLCKFLANERIEPTTWVVPPKMKLFASVVPSAEVEYYRRGPRASVNLEYDEATLSTFRGKAVYETRDVPRDVDSDPINALRRVKSIGEWHLAGNHWAVSCRGSDCQRAYTSEDMSIDIFNMDTDDFGRLDAATMLRFCNRFDSSDGGKLSGIHDRITSSTFEDLDMGDDHDMFLTPTGAGGLRPIRHIGEMSMRHWTLAQRREAAACYCENFDLKFFDGDKGYSILSANRNPGLSAADIKNVFEAPSTSLLGKTVAACYKENDDVRTFIRLVRTKFPALPSFLADFLSTKEQALVGIRGDQPAVALVTHALFKWAPSLKKGTTEGTMYQEKAIVKVVNADNNLRVALFPSHTGDISEAQFRNLTSGEKHGLALMQRSGKSFEGCSLEEVQRVVDTWSRTTVGGEEKEWTDTDISVSRDWLLAAKEIDSNALKDYQVTVPGAPERAYTGDGRFEKAGAAMEDEHLLHSFTNAARWNAQDAGGVEDMELDGGSFGFGAAGARMEYGEHREYGPRGSYTTFGMAAPHCDKKGGGFDDIVSTGLHTAMQAAATMSDPALKLCMTALMLLEPTERNFELLLNHNVPLPCKFLVVRPFRHYEAGAGILARGGIQLGANLYGRVNFQFGDNILAKTHVGHLSFYHRSVVRSPKMYVVADAMFCLGYIRGENLTFFENPEQFNVNNGRSEDGVDRSIFSFMVPAATRRDSLPNPLDLCGRWHGAMANGWFKSQATADNRAHFSSAAYYSSVWGFDRMRVQYDDVREDGYFQEPERLNNTICFEGMGWHSCPTSSKRRFTISSDALGPNVYRGVRAARSGCGEQFKEQNYHKKYVPF